MSRHTIGGFGPRTFPSFTWTLARVLTVLATTGLLGTATAVDAQASAAELQTAAEAGVDTSIQPGDDFFGYANGAWLRETPIPAGKDRWGARNQIDEVTMEQIAALWNGASAAPVGSNARKVVDYRAAYLNEAAIEARGIASIKPWLDRIDGIKDKAGLTQLLGSGLRADVDPLNVGVYDSPNLLGLAVEEGEHAEKTCVAYLLQGGLGLPDRDQYLGNTTQTQNVQAQYLVYIANMLALADFDHAAQRAEAVMALETSIAQTHATADESSVERNADNIWTRDDFARRAPGMDWSAFLAAAGLSKQATFVVWQPSAVTGAATLVASQPLEAWKDYLRFHLIHSHADVLPRAFAQQALTQPGAAHSGVSRAQRALDATQQALGEALGRMYVEKSFPPAYKARVQSIAADVIAAFRQRVQQVTWLSPASKTEALAKLDAVYFGVGYPDKWQDYSDLTVDPQDAAGNLDRVAERTYRNAVAKLGRPVDRTQWWITPQTVGAVLLFQQDAYNFPAALLQAPKFDPRASDAANYGAIGAIIAHETSHFVDTLGADYTADGAAHHWWTPQDAANFQVATEPLVNQFGSYRPFPDMAINGKLTLTENVADLAGLAAAFDAYRHTLGDRAADKAYVRQQDRQFFIGFARSWRSKLSESALRKQVASNDHAPDAYRIATVRNIDAWYDAFDVQPGQRLYLEPKSRVRIW